MKDILKEKIIAYYTKYYRDECSLPDWKSRVETRLSEESNDRKRIDILCKNLNFDFFNKKHLIVGAGTGGLAVCLKLDCRADVYGVEPSSEEYEIIKLKCIENNIDPGNFFKAYGESLPFKDNTFEYIHCFTVLEHVSNVEKCIDEMIRVLNPGGKIIINTPNYAFPQERHYKIYFPTFLPKFFGYLYLILLGKNYHFFSGINMLTDRDLNKILIKKENIGWYRLYYSKKRNTGKMSWLTNYLHFKKFVYPQQDIIIFKNE